MKRATIVVHVDRRDVAARLVQDGGRTARRSERARHEPGHHADALRGTATAIISLRGRMHTPILLAFRAVTGVRVVRKTV